MTWQLAGRRLRRMLLRSVQLLCISCSLLLSQLRLHGMQLELCSQMSQCTDGSLPPAGQERCAASPDL